MKQNLWRLLVYLSVGILAAACQGGNSTPVPAIKDDSLITQQPCSPPCWQGLIPGQTSYTETSAFMESSPLIKGNVGKRVAVGKAGSYQNWWWVGESQGGRSPNMFDFDQAGILEQIYIYPNTDITIEDVIKKYGPPTQILMVMQKLLPPNPFVKGREGVEVTALFEKENFIVSWFEERQHSFSFPMRFCPSLNTNIESLRFGTPDKIQSEAGTWSLIKRGIITGLGDSYVHLKDGQVKIDCVEFK